MATRRDAARPEAHRRRRHRVGAGAGAGDRRRRAEHRSGDDGARALLARSRNVRNNSALCELGVAMIGREMLDSAPMSARSVLETLDWQPPQARNLAMCLCRPCVEQLPVLAPHCEDEARLIAAAQHGRRQFGELFAPEPAPPRLDPRADPRNMQFESPASRMLKFSRTQFNFLDTQTARKLERRLVERLLSSVPAADATWVESNAAEGIEHAASFGIRTEDDVLQFLWLRHRFGPDFPLEPWAQPLHSAEPDARIRLEATAARLQRCAARA